MTSGKSRKKIENLKIEEIMNVQQNIIEVIQERRLRLFTKMTLMRNAESSTE